MRNVLAFKKCVIFFWLSSSRYLLYILLKVEGVVNSIKYVLKENLNFRNFPQLFLTIQKTTKNSGKMGVL